MSRQYMMPDRTVTTSVKKMARAWMEPVKALEEYGFKLAAFDPGYTFVFQDQETVHMSTSMAHVIAGMVGPGTVNHRLEALARWAEKECGHDQFSARPFELTVYEYVRSLKKAAKTNAKRAR